MFCSSLTIDAAIVPSPVQLCALVIYVYNDWTFSSHTLNKIINSSVMIPLSSHVIVGTYNRPNDQTNVLSALEKNFTMLEQQVETWRAWCVARTCANWGREGQIRRIKTHVTIKNRCRVQTWDPDDYTQYDVFCIDTNTPQQGSSKYFPIKQKILSSAPPPINWTSLFWT